MIEKTGQLTVNNTANDNFDLRTLVRSYLEMIHAETFRKMLSAAQQGDLNAGQYTIEK